MNAQPQDQAKQKRNYEKPLSLHPMTTEEAIKILAPKKSKPAPKAQAPKK